MIATDGRRRPRRHRGPAAGICQKSVNSTGKRLVVAGCGQDSGLAIVDNFRHAPFATRNDWNARSLGRQDRHAIGLVDGRPDEQVTGRIVQRQ